MRFPVARVSVATLAVLRSLQACAASVLVVRKELRSMVQLLGRWIVEAGREFRLRMHLMHLSDITATFVSVPMRCHYRTFQMRLLSADIFS